MGYPCLMPLTENVIKNAKPKDRPYKLADALGMFLLVKPNGARLWRLKYHFAGKEKLLALGTYPDVGLKQARDYRDAARRLLREDKDPGAERKMAKRAAKVATANA